MGEIGRPMTSSLADIKVLRYVLGQLNAERRAERRNADGFLPVHPVSGPRGRLSETTSLGGDKPAE